MTTTDQEKPLSDLIDQFAALPLAERSRQIRQAAEYLKTLEGQREFEHLLCEGSLDERSADPQGS